MKLYTPKQAGVAMPLDGFINGGWYDGRNYYMGTFSCIGVIHPMLEDEVRLVDIIKFLLFLLRSK